MVSLVTGASGFLGRQLVARLQREGEPVIAMGRASGLPETGKFVTAIAADFTTFENWPSLLADVTTVYHLAWSSLPQTASAEPARDANMNVLSSLRLLEALRRRPGTRFVFASSGGAVYGESKCFPISEEHPTKPVSAYGVSKLAVESYLRFFRESHGLRPISLRIANLFGPGQSYGRNFGVISTFGASLIKGEQVTLYGDGTTVRDYIYADDVVQACIAAGRMDDDIDAVNLGMGVGHSLNEIIHSISEISGVVPNIRYLPERAIDVKASVLDIGRAKRHLGWSPQVDLQTGMARMINDLRHRILET